ncbi:MAG TPA: PQQ-dependent sugar dehydrogenase [Pseudomonadales bacterium]|nr:PQQ-dependent sugar dehydrogenase [Pseudomonadales bacterium]
MWRLMDERGMRGRLLLALWLVIAGCGGGGGSDGSNIGVSARVPNVVGQTQAAATSAITRAGLNVGTVTTSRSATVAAGNVISQNPAAGATVAPASTVNLVVSSGPAAQVTVPNVVGQTKAAATTAITNAGLRVGTVTNAASSTVPSGNVINQTPVSGTSVAATSTVNLTVSAGPTPAFGINTRPALATFNLPTGGGSMGTLDLVPAFPGLTFASAVFMTGVPGDTRLAVVQQSGQVSVFTPSSGVTTSQVILDVSGATVFGGEQGLLGLAFDPAFVSNHFLYVHYTRASDGHSVIARFTWDGTNAVNLGTQKIILDVPDPAANHNGGMIAFGPSDGYLYVAFGDGGGANDQFGNAQNPGTLLGKILRINVHPAEASDAYDIPGDNPFVGRTGWRGEIWALGLRNPFRFSFDRGTGQLWLGDVGQDTTEEVDIITSGGNYGWPTFEGTAQFQNVALAAGTTHTPPIFEYNHPIGLSVIGGYVYRGSQIASLVGKYLYSDFYAGIVWSLSGPTNPTNTELATVPNPSSFGEDDDGEVYVVTYNDGLYKFNETGGGGSGPTLLSQTGLFTDLTNLTPASGLIEYDLNIPFWSDGALKRRWVGIPSGANVTFAATAPWTFPVGTVIVKHFDIELTEGDPNTRRRLETRLLVRDASGWQGFTFRWNDAQTDAQLLAGADSESLTVNLAAGGSITWNYSYPSRTDCLLCHTSAANFALGLGTREMNRDFDYGAVTDNQLRTLNHIDYFSTDIGAATQYAAYPALDDTNASIATRARAYLAVNCSQCHRPGGGTPVDLDFRFDTADASMNAIGVAPTQGGLDLPNARIIAPGVKESSVLWERIRRLDSSRMPPLGTHRVDQDAVDLIGVWIDSL